MFQGAVTSKDEGSLLFSKSIEHTPDAYVLALHHPVFGSGSLNELRAAYVDKIAPGAKVQLVDGDAFVKMELVDADLPNDEVRVELEGTSAIHAGRTSSRVVSATKIVGGWPSSAFAPATPVRLMRRQLSFMWPAQINEASEISFTTESDHAKKQILDEETSIADLMNAAKEGQILAISIAGTSYPLIVDYELDAKGKAATAEMQFAQTMGAASSLLKLAAGLTATVLFVGLVVEIKKTMK